MTWLRPTFRLKRDGFTSERGRFIPLPPVVVSVLEVDVQTQTALYAVLGSEATPARVCSRTLAEILRTKGTQL